MKGVESPCKFCKEVVGITEDVFDDVHGTIEDHWLWTASVAMTEMTNHEVLCQYIRKHRDQHKRCSFYHEVQDSFYEAIDGDKTNIDWVIAFAEHYRALYTLKDLKIGEFRGVDHVAALWEHGYEVMLSGIESDVVFTTPTAFTLRLNFDEFANMINCIVKMRRSLSRLDEVMIRTFVTFNPQHTEERIQVIVDQYDAVDVEEENLLWWSQEIVVQFSVVETCKLSADELMMLKLAMGSCVNCRELHCLPRPTSKQLDLFESIRKHGERAL